MATNPDFSNYNEDTLKRLVDDREYALIIRYFDETGNADSRLQIYQIEALMMISYNHMSDGRYLEGLETIEGLLSIDATNEEAWVLLGVLSRREGNLKNAETAYQRTLVLNPDHPTALYNLGNLYSDMHESQKAKDAYLALIEIDPRHSNGWNNLGVVLKEGGELKEAEHAFRKVLEIDSTNLLALTNLKDLLLEDNRQKEADDTQRQFNLLHGYGTIRTWKQTFNEEVTPRLKIIIPLYVVAVIITIGIYGSAIFLEDMFGFFAFSGVTTALLYLTGAVFYQIYQSYRLPEIRINHGSLRYLTIVATLIAADLLYQFKADIVVWIIVVMVILTIMTFKRRRLAPSAKFNQPHDESVCQTCGDPLTNQSFDNRGSPTYCGFRCNVVAVRHAIFFFGAVFYLINWALITGVEEDSFFLFTGIYSLIFTGAFLGYYANTYAYRSRFSYLKKNIAEKIFNEHLIQLTQEAKNYPSGVVYEKIDTKSKSALTEQDIIGYWRVDDYGELTGEFRPNQYFMPVQIKSDSGVPVHPVKPIFDKILTIVENINSAGLVPSLANMSIFLDNKGDYDLALEYAKQGHQRLEVADDDRGLAALNSHFGILYFQKGEFDAAKIYFQKSLDTMKDLGPHPRTRQLYKSLGLLEYEMGRLKEAQEFFKQQYDSSSDVDGSSLEEMVASNLFDFGLFLQDKHLYERSIQFYNWSLELAEEVEFSRDTATMLCNLGANYSRLGEPELAMDYYQKSLVVCEESGELSLSALNNYNLGLIYSSKETNLSNYQSAKDYFEIALTHYNDLNDLKSYGNTLHYLRGLEEKYGYQFEADQIQSKLNDVRERLNSEDVDKAEFT